MASSFRRAATVLAALTTTAAVCVAQPVLTDVTLFGSSFAGTYTAGPSWNTRAADATPNVFLSPDANAAFVAGNVVNPAGTLSLPLGFGAQTLYYFANGGFSPFFGLNLFFDGASSPGISAFNSFGTGPQLNASACTLNPTGGCTAGAGTFSFATGGYTVTLTTYTLLADAAQNGGSVDRVSDFALGANGTFDNYARLVLTVSGSSVVTPEPSTLVLLTTGSLVVGGARRRRCRHGSK